MIKHVYSSNLAIFVIGLEGGFRNPNIFEFEFSEAEIYQNFGIDARIESNRIDKIINQKRNKLFSFTPLSRGEVACSHLHLTTYKKFLELNVGWALILEDDVYLSQEIYRYRDYLKELDPKKPHIVQISPSLASKDVPHPRVLFSSNRLSMEIVNPRITASAYFINRNAAHLLSKACNVDNIYWRADWPPRSVRKIHFHVTLTNLAHHPSGLSETSIIGEARTAPKSNRELRVWKVNKYLGVNLLKALPDISLFLDLLYLNFTSPILAKFGSLMTSNRYPSFYRKKVIHLESTMLEQLAQIIEFSQSTENVEFNIASIGNLKSSYFSLFMLDKIFSFSTCTVYFGLEKKKRSAIESYYDRCPTINIEKLRSILNQVDKVELETVISRYASRSIRPRNERRAPSVLIEDEGDLERVYGEFQNPASVIYRGFNMYLPHYLKNRVEKFLDFDQSRREVEIILIDYNSFHQVAALMLIDELKMYSNSVLSSLISEFRNKLKLEP